MARKSIREHSAGDASRQAGTSRRGFLGHAAGAAGAAAVSAAVVGGVEAAGTTPASATDPVFAGPNDWINVQTNFGAAGDGVTDDTTAIKSAIAAVGPNGGVVYFPVGVYVTSSPIVVSKSGTVLMGSGPLATQGGGGSGSGQFTPGTPGTISNTVMAGSVIAPASNWTQGTAAEPAAILFDSTGTTLVKAGIERIWVHGGKAVNSAGTPIVLHGIAAKGAANGLYIHGCGVTVLYSASSIGIAMIPDSGGDAGGVLIDQCQCQFIGSHGFYGSFGDSTITRCHSQSIGGTGFFLSVSGVSGFPAGANGGNIRVTDCRADLGAQGFVTDIPAGEFLGMIQISNCSTQRNKFNGFYIQNTGPQEICPVYLSNCVAQGDGTAGGTNAGYRIAGPCAVSMTNCSCHVNTIDVSAGCPPYAVATTSDGIASPAFVQIVGGFMNAANGSAWSDVVNAPLASNVQVFGYAQGQWTYNIKPNLEGAI